MRARRSPKLLLALAASLLPGPAAAQETLERTPNIGGAWVGVPGVLQVNVPYRLSAAPVGPGLVGVPTFELGMSLPRASLLGARFAPGSPTVPDRPDEWEVFGRLLPLTEARGHGLDLAGGLAYNGAARSLDGEVALARWIGPVRLLGVGRAMSNAYDEGRARFAGAAGAVVHPLPGRAPIALAGDVGTLFDREPGERVAWSAAVQVGVSFTTHTLSLFATNTAASTLQGVSRGEGRVRWGVEFTAPIPVGRFLGWYVPRQEAMAAVATAVPPTAGAFRAEARNYLFFPMRIEVPAGTTIEWTNEDDVVHTVTATDRSWDSGAIRPGETWRARFDRPGLYPFLCSPHPFMQGVVIVR